MNLGTIPRIFLMSFSSDVPCPDRVICEEGWRSEIKSNRADSFFYSLVRARSSINAMSLHEKQTVYERSQHLTDKCLFT
jgi:hypothetical protein